MGYHVIDVGDLEPLPDRTATGYEISDHYVPSGDAVAHDATRGPRHVGLRVYHGDPGEELGGAMHYHEEQEEIFHVVSGIIHLKTPEETIEVTAGQTVVIEPGHPQHTFVPADADESAHVIAIGAPSYRDLGRNDAVAYEE